jgi:hypothetical protein
MEKVRIISKGCRYSNLHIPEITFRSEISGVVKFPQDTSYDLQDKNLQFQSNKAVGLSDGYHHHRHSVRIGWRYNLERCATEIVIILYRAGHRDIYHVMDSGMCQSFSVDLLLLQVRPSSYRVTDR